MEFSVQGNQVLCVRAETDADTGGIRRHVVASFDAHLDAVAPHVMARLSPDELVKLKAWLSDRRKLRDREAHETLLESVPELLSRAESALLEQGAVSGALVSRLRESVARFSRALELAATTGEGAPPTIEEMDDSEALKERINIVRQDL